MHSENNELVRAGHELAKCLDNEPLLDIAKMIVRLSDKLEVTTAALREKTKQCEQLAEENAGLKGAISQHAAGFTVCEACGEENVSGNDDVCRALNEAPATDAFLREVRAQGVEAFADSKYCQEESQSGAHEFAAELRQGGAA
ncbi:hypothetical protein G9G39_06270 [Cronobacter sp. EKM101R]|uniref:hypothetical protein n=1 Tax=unclassified Cronobacter TaxID=2649764 RepID=UPI0013EDE5B6|nr:MULTISPECIES: hypothetical protein [unclassified Cronobacter]KAF6596666.1 hypothetical protein G9G39_06270 [Cronobacter sp. EKM101R]KAF6599492.1 hypothetical protein G9G38_05905 [Cronobacter sp. EKM102R]